MEIWEFMILLGAYLKNNLETLGDCFWPTVQLNVGTWRYRTELFHNPLSQRAVVL